MCDYSLESFNFREAKDEQELRAVVLVRGVHQGAIRMTSSSLAMG